MTNSVENLYSKKKILHNFILQFLGTNYEGADLRQIICRVFKDISLKSLIPVTIFLRYDLKLYSCRCCPLFGTPTQSLLFSVYVLIWTTNFAFSCVFEVVKPVSAVCFYQTQLSYTYLTNNHFLFVCISFPKNYLLGLTMTVKERSKVSCGLE